MSISFCFWNSPLVSFWSGLAGAPCWRDSRLKAACAHWGIYALQGAPAARYFAMIGLTRDPWIRIARKMRRLDFICLHEVEAASSHLAMALEILHNHHCGSGKVQLHPVDMQLPAERIILTLGFMALLAIASLIPGHSESGDPAIIRLVAKIPAQVQKVLHVCFYGVLVLLLVWTLERIQIRNYRFLASFVFAVSFGAVMEWCQTKVPGRFGTAHDIALNAAGATLGLLIAIFLF
jgi:VanZ family protein